MAFEFVDEKPKREIAIIDSTKIKINDTVKVDRTTGEILKVIPKKKPKTKSIFTSVEVHELTYIVMNFARGAHKLNLKKKQPQALLREPIIQSILKKLK